MRQETRKWHSRLAALALLLGTFGWQADGVCQTRIDIGTSRLSDVAATQYNLSEELSQAIKASNDRIMQGVRTCIHIGTGSFVVTTSTSSACMARGR